MKQNSEYLLLYVYISDMICNVFIPEQAPNWAVLGHCILKSFMNVVDEI